MFEACGKSGWVLHAFVVISNHNHPRAGHVRRADRALRSEEVLEWLQKAIQTHGAPESLCSDVGSELIAPPVQRWLAEPRIRTIYLDPGSPWQNGFVESFHGRFRDACLNRKQLWSLSEARIAIEDFHQHRPHRKPHTLSLKNVFSRVLKFWPNRCLISGNDFR